MVAVPETVGVHRKTSSGELPELPQLPACELVPLVVPLNVPPAAAMTVGLLQAPGRAAVGCQVAPRHAARVAGPERVSVQLLHSRAWPPPWPPLTRRLRP